jgi:hypothetical protein
MKNQWLIGMLAIGLGVSWAQDTAVKSELTQANEIPSSPVIKDSAAKVESDRPVTLNAVSQVKSTLPEVEEEQTIASDPATFRNSEYGTARFTQSFEVNLMGGMANSVFGYSLAWNRIFQGGKSEIHLPFTWLPLGTEPSEKPDYASTKIRISNPSHQLIGLGLIYRHYFGENYDGVIVGGGIRGNYWKIGYDFSSQDGAKSRPINKEIFSLIPLAESGYSYPIEAVRGLSARGTVELGWILVQENYESQDIAVRFPIEETMPYWTINLGAVYAF